MKYTSSLICFVLFFCLFLDVPFLFDLGSAHGTFVNKQQIPPHEYIELHVGDMIRFGASTRYYILNGPEHLRPKEQSKNIQRYIPTIQQIKTKQSTDTNVDPDSEGASWGMKEDAINDEDHTNKFLLSTDGSNDIKPDAPLSVNQQKFVDRANKVREKISNLTNEIDLLRSKDLKQGGLTDGQQNQIERNEQRIKQLTDDLENIELQLNETINDQQRRTLGSDFFKTKVSKYDNDEEGTDNTNIELYTISYIVIVVCFVR
jgi:hypothetical protein